MRQGQRWCSSRSRLWYRTHLGRHGHLQVNVALLGDGMSSSARSRGGSYSRVDERREGREGANSAGRFGDSAEGGAGERGEHGR